ncbi:MAG: hypothetical protein WAL56_14620 [Candidatus Sulfotelmatobacter sp.]
MQIAHTHWIPAYIFDEIAATQGSEKRDRLLSICRRLKGISGKVLITPSFLIEAAIRIFAEFGKLDWEVLLESQPKYEKAIVSGVFDDDLARVQLAQNRKNLKKAEEYFAQTRAQFDSLFQSGSDRTKTLEEIIAQARSTGVIQQNVRYYCESFLGHAVNLQYVERFLRTFPPIGAMIYAFLIGHYHRNKPGPTRNPAGAIDLLAAVYLPVCHKFVCEDRNQQSVLRDVVKYCPLRTEVIRFNDDFRNRFSGCI